MPLAAPVPRRHLGARLGLLLLLLLQSGQLEYTGRFGVSSLSPCLFVACRAKCCSKVWTASGKLPLVLLGCFA